MAFVDRVLTLKLATDVGDINAKMNQTGGQMGRLAGQVAGFAKATAIGLALEGIDQAVQRFGKGIEDARAYRNTLAGLNLALGNVGTSGQEAADAVDALNARSLDLGFDDVETLGAFQQLVNLTGDVDEAMLVMEAAFNRARAEQKPLGTAVEETIRLYRGGTRQMDLFGLEVDEYGKNVATGLERVTAGLGVYEGAADTFASTTEGMAERVGVMSDRMFATLGEEVLKLGDELLPVLIDDVLPALGTAFETVQPFLQRIGETLGTVGESAVELWNAAEPLRDALAPVVDLMGQGFIASLEAIDGLLNGLAQLLRGDLQGALTSFANAALGLFDPVIEAVRDGINGLVDLLRDFGFGGFTVNIPTIDIPNPAHGTIFDPIGEPYLTFGGGSWNMLPSFYPFSGLPKLAAGGIVTAPTVAMIGEAGPEAVIPLDRAGGAMAQTVINVSTIGDPAAIEDAVVNALRRTGTANGSVVLSRLRPVGVG